MTDISGRKLDHHCLENSMVPIMRQAGSQPQNDPRQLGLEEQNSIERES